MDSLERSLIRFYLIGVVVVSFLLLSFSFAFGDTWTDEEIADAIFKAEGGMKAEYWYGIRSVSYDSLKEARRICLNTIRNQRRRHAEHDCNFTYLECLANRYAPLNVNNDPKNLNQYWLKNVRYFLGR